MDQAGDERAVPDAFVDEPVAVVVYAVAFVVRVKVAVNQVHSARCDGPFEEPVVRRDAGVHDRNDHALARCIGTCLRSVDLAQSKLVFRGLLLPGPQRQDQLRRQFVDHRP